MNGEDIGRFFLDLPYLRKPAWQALDILPVDMVKAYLQKALEFMEQNKVNVPKGKYYGFNDFEVNKMRRLIALVTNKKIDSKQLVLNKVNFYKFFSEHDRRRQTHFVETFPELKTFWKECQKLSRNYDKGRIY